MKRFDWFDFVLYSVGLIVVLLVGVNPVFRKERK